MMASGEYLRESNIEVEVFICVNIWAETGGRENIDRGEKGQDSGCTPAWPRDYVWVL